MLRAADILRQIAPRALPNYAAAFAGGDAALQDAGVTTKLRLAHFMAQALYETGLGAVLFESLDYTTPARLLAIFGVGNHSAAIRPEEVAGMLGNARALAERVYGLGNPAKAAELGNTQPGDGFRYRGGGLLQTTGRANYRRYGFEGAPEMVVDPAHALAPAMQEWTAGRLNAAADANDIRTITRVINGGYNGLAGRQVLFARIAALPDTPLDTAWLQAALNRLGATLAVDGVPGPATAAALAHFQAQSGLLPDGIAGPATLAALHKATE